MLSRFIQLTLLTQHKLLLQRMLLPTVSFIAAYAASNSTEEGRNATQRPALLQLMLLIEVSAAYATKASVAAARNAKRFVPSRMEQYSWSIITSAWALCVCVREKGEEQPCCKVMVLTQNTPDAMIE
eukprot:441293-Ditylum_brightwellii.AAC.2